MKAVRSWLDEWLSRIAVVHWTREAPNLFSRSVLSCELLSLACEFIGLDHAHSPLANVVRASTLQPTLGAPPQQPTATEFGAKTFNPPGRVPALPQLFVLAC